MLRLGASAGWTPLHHAERLGDEIGSRHLRRDEGLNVTGSFQARGWSAWLSAGRA
ncbi:MAG: hypothetical protein H6644_08415 [Caldilineaceae bacterium]|nr:hypothetical protein [Caldilineaceae bacterium]